MNKLESNPLIPREMLQQIDFCKAENRVHTIYRHFVCSNYSLNVSMNSLSNVRWTHNSIQNKAVRLDTVLNLLKELLRNTHVQKYTDLYEILEEKTKILDSQSLDNICNEKDEEFYNLAKELFNNEINELNKVAVQRILEISGKLPFQKIFDSQVTSEELRVIPLQEFVEAIKLNPTDPIPYVNLARVLEGHPKEIDSSIIVMPASISNLIPHTITLSNGLRMTKEELILKAIDLDPNCSYAYFTLGLLIEERIQLLNGIHMAKQELFLKAWELKSNNVNAILHLASTLTPKDNLKLPDGSETSALELYQKALELEPNNYLVHLMFAYLLESAAGEKCEGIRLKNEKQMTNLQFYQNAIELAPNKAECYLLLGINIPLYSCVTLFDGKIMTQHELFLKAIELDPDTALMVKNFYLEAMKSNPNDSNIHNFLEDIDRCISNMLFSISRGYNYSSVEADKALANVWVEMRNSLLETGVTELPQSDAAVDEIRAFLNDPSNKILFAKVKKFNFNDKNLSVIPIEIEMFNDLEILNICNNKLKNIPNFHLPNLRELRIANNQLTQISNLFLLNLEVLGLESNQLREIEGLILPSLKYLFLTDNYLKYVPNFDLPNLEHLILNDNILKEIPSFNLQELKILALNNNQLTEIPSLNCPNLRSMRILDNPLTENSKNQIKSVFGVFVLGTI